MLLCSCTHAVNQKYRKSEISLDSGTHGTHREAALLTHNKLKWRHATPAILRHSTFKTKNPGLTFSLVPHCMCWGVINRELLLADHSFYEVRIDVKLRIESTDVSHRNSCKYHSTGFFSTVKCLMSKMSNAFYKSSFFLNYSTLLYGEKLQ